MERSTVPASVISTVERSKQTTSHPRAENSVLSSTPSWPRLPNSAIFFTLAPPPSRLAPVESRPEEQTDRARKQQFRPISAYEASQRPRRSGRGRLFLAGREGSRQAGSKRRRKPLQRAQDLIASAPVSDQNGRGIKAIGDSSSSLRSRCGTSLTE